MLCSKALKDPVDDEQRVAQRMKAHQEPYFSNVAKKKAGSSSHSSSSHQLSVLTQADDEQDDKEHSLSNNQASCSSQSNAPHPAALSKPLQRLVDGIRSLGRLPKYNTGASAEDQLELSLYKRYWWHKEQLPEDLLQEDDKADALDVFNCQLLLDFVLLSLR